MIPHEDGNYDFCGESAPVCDRFQDNDQGVCMECGHYKACHDGELK